jgi:hypothetical protein
LIASGAFENTSELALRHRFKIFQVGEMHGKSGLLSDDESRVFHEQFGFGRPQCGGSAFMLVFGCGLVATLAAEAKGKERKAKSKKQKAKSKERNMIFSS